MFDIWHKIIVYGKHADLIQRTLDYDFLIDKEPSIVAIVSNAVGDMKLFYGDQEIIIPVIKDFDSIRSDYHLSKHIDTKFILINLASSRSAHQVTVDACVSGLFASIVVIAEWIPERQSKELIHIAQQSDVQLIWPSTVWLIIPWVLRVGHTGGDLSNMCESRLYQRGSLWLVSKSWGMINELCRVVSQNSDGVAAAISLGWDRFPYLTFVDVIHLYESDPQVKMIVLFGEVGNQEENHIAQLVQEGVITKPIIARVAGQSAEQLAESIQFGHAGAKANKSTETASYKMQSMRDAGIVVAHSYEELWAVIRQEYERIIGPIDIQPVRPDIIAKVTQLQQRRHTLITSRISNESWDELTYDGIPVSEFVSQWSIANVIGHLWLQKDLPGYALEFITTCIILLADHGPGVSGALNTIITTRAGNNMISSLVSWLLTIGPRFGGAMDDCAKMLLQSWLDQFSAAQVVEQYKHSGIPIPGIGHKVKSKNNPDRRCQILWKMSKSFPQSHNLIFAQSIESLTLEKKSNLILNVDWYVAAMFLDILSDMSYDITEQKQIIDSWMLNGIFVLARTIGLIWHHLDQKRIGDWLVRLTNDDILYQ